MSVDSCTIGQGQAGVGKLMGEGNMHGVGKLVRVIASGANFEGPRIRIRSDPLFFPGSRSGFQIFLDLDPVFNFFLDPDPVSASGSRSTRSAERALKVRYNKKT